MSELHALSHPDPLLGQLLGERYLVLRRLGQGGMGAVYEARHVLIEKRVAIKVLLPGYAAEEGLMARFHREALAVARAGNEHVIDVTDLGKLADGGWFIVFELLEGRDWAAELRDRGPQPVEVVAHIAAQVCEALQAAHESGVVHRDLKPGNVFLLRRGGDPHFVKVLDFGLAKIRDGAPGAGDGLTAPQAPIGTLEYMSPEQMEGRHDVDARSDLYALGVILFEALTGTVPFTAETPRRLMIKVLSEMAPSLSQRQTELPPAICELVARLLDKDPARRPSDCDEVRRILLPFARQASHGIAPALRGGVTSIPEEPVAAVAAAPTPPRPLVTEPSLSLSSASLGDVAPALRGGATSSTASSSEQRFERELRPRRALRVALAGGAVAVAVGILAAMDASRERPLPGPTLSTVDPVRAPAAKPAAPETVRLQVTAEPRSATITLDGAPLANAVALRWPRSDRPQRLRVAHPGYAPIEQTLVLASDQQVAIALALQAPPAIARAPRARPSAPQASPAAAAIELPVQARVSPSPTASAGGTNTAPPPAPVTSQQSELLPMPL